MKPARALRPLTRRFDTDLLRVGGLASLVSVFSLLYYFQRGQILLYGDAVAHINIARRVFDSATPGLVQLGTVWLPLPHLLMIPFLLSNSLWQSGVGGSIPSMVGYVLGVVGIFRLVRRIVGTSSGPASAAPWLAALVYGANPNLIYLQTTAMTESLYMAFFVWAVVYLFEFLAGLSKNTITTEDTGEHRGKIWKCVACLVGAELTRYDGWFLAGAVGAVIVVFSVRRWKDRWFARRALAFLLGIAVAPALWINYNAVVYGHALEFVNGPYSAQAIERQSGAINPAKDHMVVAARFFLKSAQLNVANGNWGRIWLAVAVAVLLLSAIKRGVAIPILLLWTPFVLYSFSIAHGGVPLYIPPWWPFTWYNIRYGLQFLPVFAASAAIVAATAAQSVKRYPWAVVIVIGGLVVASYASVWRAQPLCLTEALVNSRTRLSLERAVARAIEQAPPQSRFLMYVGHHVGVFEQAGIPLRQVVNEGNHRPWKKPSDPEGLWERALSDPPRYVDYVIAFEEDYVDRGVNRTNLKLLSVIHTTGQAPARIYACASQERAPLH